MGLKTICKFQSRVFLWVQKESKSSWIRRQMLVNKLISPLKSVIGLFVILIIVACNTQKAEQRSQGSKSPTPSAEIIKTATVQWFPATATQSPRIVVTSAKEAAHLPSFGNKFIQEEFNTLSMWSNIGIFQGGSIFLENNSITITVKEPKTRISSVYTQYFPSHYYLTLKTQVNLCSPDDEYGIILKMTSPSNLIRYGLSCNGRIQIVRVINGNSIYSLPWQTSGSIPPGAPSINSLGVWVSEEEIRFFINDQLQYTLHS